jgi:hypothetical protein
MPDAPSDRAITLANSVLRALDLVIGSVRRDVMRLTVEHSTQRRKPTDRTPVQMAVANAQPAIRKIAATFQTSMAAIIDGDKWTAQLATQYTRKLNAALDKRARAEPPPGNQIFATAAFLIEEMQFISVVHPGSGQKKEYH